MYAPLMWTSTAQYSKSAVFILNNTGIFMPWVLEGFWGVQQSLVPTSRLAAYYSLAGSRLQARKKSDPRKLRIFDNSEQNNRFSNLSMSSYIITRQKNGRTASNRNA